MKILAFDTSTKFLSIALLEDEEAKAEFHEDAGLRHSQILIPTIKKMLEEKKWDIKEIGLVCVGLGPGSFTGIRIANATVKGLAAVLDCKTIGVPTMDAMTGNMPESEKIVAPLLDARKGKVYSCIYSAEGTGYIKITDYLLLEIDELLDQLESETIFFGDAIEKYKEKLDNHPKAKYLEDFDWYPRAATIGKMGFARSRASTDDAETLEPLYLHAKECNITGRKS
jgi:tRNA threonylcarbamoyladenosine biosynthesis protein TsaB